MPTPATDAYQPGPALTELLNDLVSDIYAMRRADGSRIRITVSKGANTYRYFEGRNGVMFCWTVRPCDRGQYYAFNYIPVGKGSRTGNARRWRMVDLVSFSHRNKAKARASARRGKETAKEATS
jgi:hypothetical protein